MPQGGSIHLSGTKTSKPAEQVMGTEINFFDNVSLRVKVNGAAPISIP